MFSVAHLMLDTRFSILDEEQKNLNMRNCTIEHRVSSIENPELARNKGIDNNNTLAYVPPKFQMLLQAPVAQPG